MGHNVFGLIGYGIFSFLFMKVSKLKNPKIKILIIVSFNSLDILGGSNGLNWSAFISKLNFCNVLILNTKILFKNLIFVTRVESCSKFAINVNLKTENEL